MYDKAILLIKKGLAYVCDLNGEEIKNIEELSKNLELNLHIGIDRLRKI